MSAADDDGRPFDPRRALGRRPGGQPSRLHIDDSSFHTIQRSPIQDVPLSPRAPQISLTIPTSPSANHSSSYFSAGPPSPTSPNTSRFRRPTISRAKPPQASQRGLKETQKLLSHLLERLENRDSAPDPLARALITAKQINGRTKSKQKGKAVRIGQVVASAAQTSLSVAQGHHGHIGAVTSADQGIDSDEAFEHVRLGEGDFDTGQICDLVEQTRGLLIIANKQGLDLFSSDNEERLPSSNNLQSTKRKPGRFSSFASPVSPKVASFASRDDIESITSRDSGTLSGQVLLSRLISTLRSLIEVDCTHRVHHFRLLQPPLALQAACLDIASWLYHTQGWAIKVDIVGLVIGGLYTMGESFTDRICEWLEGRVLELLRRLAKERGRGDSPSTWNDPFDPDVNVPAVPTFAFSVVSETARSTGSIGWRDYSPPSPNPLYPPHGLHGVLSTYNASMTSSALTIQLASMVSRLFLALATTVDTAASRLSTIYRVHRLQSLIVSAKPDCSLDLLGIIACAPPASRRRAVETLTTYFPQEVGHNSITRRPASTAYLAQRTKWETGQEKALGEDSTEEHHFIPWRLSSRDGNDEGKCYSCHGDIHGFCIKCTLCRQYLHLQCYRRPESGFEHPITSSSPSIPTVLRTKFSLCLSQLDGLLDVVGSSSSDTSRMRRGDHDLQLVNLFTTTICGECDLPVWGSTAQCYACLAGCQKVYHPHCIDRLAIGRKVECYPVKDIVKDKVAAGPTRFAISYSALSDSFDETQGYLRVSEDALEKRTFDEVAIMYGALWTQYQLLKHGLTSGSIQVTERDDSRTESDILGFRPYLKAYEEHMRINEQLASSAATDFGHVVNAGHIPREGYLFSGGYLTYVSALLKCPSRADKPSSPTPSGDFLDVQTAHWHEGVHAEADRSVFEALELSTTAHTLALDQRIHDPRLAAIFLNQLRLSGLLTTHSKAALTAQDVQKGATMCGFGLPLLMDSSPAVELLISSIGKLLSDLDLTMNEVALRLAYVRAWPSVLCSPYTLERLGRLLLEWIVTQDETIHEVVKHYASKNRRLPGVRSGSKGSSSVQVYKDGRMALQLRHVHPWLQALHNLDSAAYVHTIYEACISPDSLLFSSDENADETASDIADRALERMAMLAEAGVLFSVQLDLLTAWLEDLGGLAEQDHIYRSLPRLFRGTASTFGDGNVWELCQAVASEGLDGLTRVIRWLRVLSFSGVEVPWSLVKQIANIGREQALTTESRMDLIVSINANSTPIEPSEFAELCCRMFVDSVEAQKDTITSHTDAIQEVLKRHMLVIVRAFGVTLEDVADTKLFSPGFEAKQPASVSRRKRHTTAHPLLSIDDALVGIMAKLLRRKMLPTEVTLDFMWLLFTRSANVVNIDGFLHNQCSVLYPALWELTDYSTERQSRARVFLRLLAVNSAPMEQIIREEFHKGNRHELRERLLRFTLELADDALTQENLAWRRASVGLVTLFFEALLDHTDVSPDNLVIVRGMLPTQLKAVSGCFEEFLAQTSDAGRLGLMARLHRLRIALPSWPIISWTLMDDLLVETNASISQMTPARSSQSISALLDAEKVRANLVALCLDMMATGVEIPWSSAQRIQAHVSQSLSLPLRNISFDPVCTLVLPMLRSVLDSPKHLTIGSQSVESRTKKTALVGALFVPLVIELARDLGKYDFSTQRAVLDIMYTTFFKQSTRNVELSALGALQSIADFVSQDGSVENRLLGLGILQTAMGRVERDSLVRAVPLIFAIVGGVLVSETEDDGDNAIINQSRILLKTIIKTFPRSRLFAQLFRNDALVQAPTGKFQLSKALQMLRSTDKPGMDGTVKFSVLDLAIGDLVDVFKKGRQTIEQVLQSFERFVSIIEGDISEDALIAFGSFVTRLGKHITEWDGDEFDPNPILRACASLLCLSPPQTGSTLLYQTSTLLHLSLSQFPVNGETVRRLVNASDRVAKGSDENTIRTVMFELVKSALNGQSIQPITLDALLLFVDQLAYPSAGPGGTAASPLRRLLSDSSGGCMTLLLRQHASLSRAGIEPDCVLSIMERAATIVFRGDMALPGTMDNHLQSIITEAASTQLGVFSYILYASCGVSMGEGRIRILSVYPILARAISLSLRGTADLLAVKDLEGAGADHLSVVFTVFRLAMIASRDRIGVTGATDTEDGSNVSTAPSASGEEEVVDSLWKRIWPDWYRLLSLSAEKTCVNTPLRNIAHAVFLDTLIYLHTIQSPVLIAHAGSLSHALRLLRRNQGTAGHGVAKMMKAEVCVRDAALDNGKVDYDAVKEILRADLIVSERLRGLRLAAQ